MLRLKDKIKSGFNLKKIKEKEQHGEKIFIDNMAKILLDKIRKRKV